MISTPPSALPPPRNWAPRLAFREWRSRPLLNLPPKNDCRATHVPSINHSALLDHVNDRLFFFFLSSTHARRVKTTSQEPLIDLEYEYETLRPQEDAPVAQSCFPPRGADHPLLFLLESYSLLMMGIQRFTFSFALPRRPGRSLTGCTQLHLRIWQIQTLKRPRAPPLFFRPPLPFTRLLFP